MLFNPDMNNKQIKDNIFVVFDIETTGFDSEKDKILEIAAIKFTAKDDLDTFQTLIHPGLNLSRYDYFTDVHDITSDMVKKKPKIDAVLPQFIEFIGNDSVLIAHNARFDIGFISKAISINKFKYPKNIILDTIRLSRKLFPGSPDYSLETITSFLKIRVKTKHRAFKDCLACKNVFLKCLSKIGPLLNYDVLKLINLHGRTFRFHNVSTVVSIDGKQIDYIKTSINKSNDVLIEYTDYNGNITKRKIKPMEIYISDGKEYLKSFCYLRKEERSFRMSRITKVEQIC